MPFVNCSFRFGKRQCQHCQHSDLSGKRFGGSDSDFRPYVDIRTGVSGTGNRRPDSIANTIYKCSAAFCQFHSSQSIRSLTALGDCYHYILSVNHRITVTKFGSILHFHRYAAETFNQMLSNQSGMPGSSAGNDNKPLGIQQLFPMIDHSGKYHIVCFHIDTSTHTIMNTIGLFENLFQHKMRISPFFQLAEIKLHFFNFRCHFNITQVDHLQFFSQMENSNFSVFQINHLICIFYNRSGIRSKEELVRSNPHYQRATLTGSNNLIGMLFIKNRNRIGTNHFSQRQLNGCQQTDLISDFHVFY